MNSTNDDRAAFELAWNELRHKNRQIDEMHRRITQNEQLMRALFRYMEAQHSLLCIAMGISSMEHPSYGHIDRKLADSIPEGRTAKPEEPYIDPEEAEPLDWE